jgi:thiamine biosynthesis lipoprotein
MSPLTHRPSRRQVLALGAAVLAAPGILRAGPQPLQRLEGRAFATGWSVIAAPGPDLAACRPELEAVCAEVDSQMSPWRADSEIARLNAAGAGTVRVSPDTARVAGAALALAERSGGAFDPTVGPLVARWGFGPILTGAVGRQALGVEGDRITKAEPGATLDLCGIAKGHALDRMAGALAQAGTASALIDLGGELAALGTHPDGRAWRVAVEHPSGEGAAAVLALPAGQAVATSGLAAQSYGLPGAEVSHIIDPRRGRPVGGPLRSVSVLGPTGMAADGWATALMAAGAEAGPDMARRAGLAALFVLAEGDRLRLLPTGEMAAHLL